MAEVVAAEMPNLVKLTLWRLAPTSSSGTYLLQSATCCKMEQQHCVRADSVCQRSLIAAAAGSRSSGSRVQTRAGPVAISISVTVTRHDQATGSLSNVLALVAPMSWLSLLHLAPQTSLLLV